MGASARAAAFMTTGALRLSRTPQFIGNQSIGGAGGAALRAGASGGAGGSAQGGGIYSVGLLTYDSSTEMLAVVPAVITATNVTMLSNVAEGAPAVRAMAPETVVPAVMEPAAAPTTTPAARSTSRAGY